MSDRVCIASMGALQTRIFTVNLLSCCSSCGNGCNWGWTSAAWEYWQRHVYLMEESKETRALANHILSLLVTITFRENMDPAHLRSTQPLDAPTTGSKVTLSHSLKICGMLHNLIVWIATNKKLWQNYINMDQLRLLPLFMRIFLTINLECIKEWPAKN